MGGEPGPRETSNIKMIIKFIAGKILLEVEENCFTILRELGGIKHRIAIVFTVQWGGLSQNTCSTSVQMKPACTVPCITIYNSTAKGVNPGDQLSGKSGKIIKFI